MLPSVVLHGFNSQIQMDFLVLKKLYTLYSLLDLWMQLQTTYNRYFLLEMGAVYICKHL